MRPTHLRAAGLAALCAAGALAGCSGEPAGPPGAQRPPATVAPDLPGARPVPLPEPLPPATPVPSEVELDRENRALLAQARRSGQPVVILLVAAEPGRTAQAAAGLEELGGIISAREPAEGYLRVSMPTKHVEKAAALPAVRAVDIDRLIPRDQPRPLGS